MSSGDEKFEKVDSGSSNTFPISAGDVKKNSYMVFQNRPCKVVDYKHFKVGKHGAAKANITGIDIFNGKKYEDTLPCSHNVQVPIIKRSAFTLIDIDNEGYMTLMDKQGNSRQDLRLPDDTEDDKTLSERIKSAHEEGKEIIINVIEAMGIEKVAEMTDKK